MSEGDAVGQASQWGRTGSDVVRLSETDSQCSLEAHLQSAEPNKIAAVLRCKVGEPSNFLAKRQYTEV